MKEMSTIYNLFYDGLPKELQDHIYSFDDTYINLYNKALFRNEIQFVHKLRLQYDLPSFVIQCPCDKTGEDIELLAKRIESKLLEKMIYYPYKHTVAQREGIAFESLSRILRLQLYYRAFPVSIKLLPAPNIDYRDDNDYDITKITEVPFTKLLDNVSPKRFLSYRWPFYENRSSFTHTYDIKLWPKMSLFQVIFRNDWTFGEIMRTVKCLKEEGFGVMYIDDYETCVDNLRGIPQDRSMYYL